ncbi:hypothetical protein ACGFYV_16085 [Streptomyces sp. NPDC048297]|uniref:hypothetical protein n=1 Tax=Streptomyces sp. NPDC048297 TaxID=3365531 RepID=UPI00371550FF
MPRGRHRHSPPLHRLLPPSAIAGVSVVCALAPWVFSEAMVLRAAAAAAALTAVGGAIVMRRWDAQAGRQVADLTRARASDEWRFEERVAELETDLEESRELRIKLEQRLRAKRAELAGLRNEHAALLRRYATAETERASALEGRRLLELEAAPSSTVPALPPARRAEPEPEPQSQVPAASVEAVVPQAAAEETPERRVVFSAEGALLYRRAAEALARFGREASVKDGSPEDEAADGEAAGAAVDGAVKHESVETESVEPEAVEAESVEAESGAQEPGAAESETEPVSEAEPEAVSDPVSETESSVAEADDADAVAKGEGAAEGVTEAVAAASDEAQGPGQGPVGDSDVHARAAVVSEASELPAKHQGSQPAGHFTVPTAVAVVPAAPARRPMVEGGFDFFGTQKQTSSAALDSVQNEDLADVVGQEALALHKAETEAEFKAADTRSRGVGQVIDLTAHDETEQIDLQGLRSAAS